MKQLILCLTIFVFSFSAESQQLLNFDEIKLVEKSDYDSAANKAALEAANYILATPLELTSDRAKCIQYTMR